MGRALGGQEEHDHRVRVAVRWGARRATAEWDELNWVGTQVLEPSPRGARKGPWVVARGGSA